MANFCSGHRCTLIDLIPGCSGLSHTDIYRALSLFAQHLRDGRNRLTMVELYKGEDLIRKEVYNKQESKGKRMKA